MPSAPEPATRAGTERILAIGVFDLFHVGHLRYLQYARAQGSHLTVAVAPDEMCYAIKQRYPVIPQDQRIEIVSALACVDEARLQPVVTFDPVLRADWIVQWGIQHVVAGGGWKGSERWTRLGEELARRNVALSYATYTEGISTTQLLSKLSHD